MTEKNLSGLLMLFFCYRMINCTVTYITQNISNKAKLENGVRVYFQILTNQKTMEFSIQGYEIEI